MSETKEVVNSAVESKAVVQDRQLADGDLGKV